MGKVINGLRVVTMELPETRRRQRPLPYSRGERAKAERGNLTSPRSGGLWPVALEPVWPGACEMCRGAGDRSSQAQYVRLERILLPPHPRLLLIVSLIPLPLFPHPFPYKEQQSLA